jgi:molybdopterin converting factor small subunit
MREDKMPAVHVNLYAGFRRKIGGQSSVDVPIESGQTIEQLLEQLGVPLAKTRIIFCNNRLVDRTQVLSGGETIGVFPAVGGG